MNRFVRLSSTVAVCGVMVIFGMANMARAAIITSLSDNFPGSSVNGSNWTESDFGRNGNAASTYNAPSVASNQLTLGGMTNHNFWAGDSLESVNSFSSSLQTTVSVDRVSLSGSGTAYESSLWIIGNNGDEFELGQDEGSGADVLGWQYLYTVGSGSGRVSNSNLGSGQGIPSFDTLAPDQGNYTLGLVFTPEGGDNVEITPYLDGNAGPTTSFSNWTDTSFQVVLMGEARADGDTVEAVFSNFDAAAVPEPSSLMLAGIGAIALCFVLRHRRVRPRSAPA